MTGFGCEKLGGSVSFHKLAASSKGRILLANLHQTATLGLVLDPVRKDALRGLHAALSKLRPKPRHQSILRAFGDFLHMTGSDYKILANERPDERDRIALVVDFGKIRAILSQMQRRIRQDQMSDAAIIQTALSSGANRAAILAAVDLINRYRDGLNVLTISNVNLLIWGAPVAVLQSVIASPTLPPDQRANRLRDALGLIHLNPGATEPERHMFMFSSDKTLAEIRAQPTHYSIARPTTFDGFDNPRFSQREQTGRRMGWGNTIDLAAGRCVAGLPEAVITPLSISHFTCVYLGELFTPHFASDDDYFAMLAPPPPVCAEMANTLDSLATAP